MLVFVLAQASEAPDLSNLWGLGVVAVAVLVGAAGAYRYGTVPERERADRLETALLEKVIPALEAARRSVERRDRRP